MDLDELLGIDGSDPEQVLAIDLADGHRQMMDALVALRRSHGLRQKDVAARRGSPRVRSLGSRAESVTCTCPPCAVMRWPSGRGSRTTSSTIARSTASDCVPIAPEN